MKLPYELNLVLNGVWQVSSKQVIPSAQLFQIGGPTTVRGYPTDAVAGPAGFYTNLELHKQLPFLDSSVDGFLFYDEGAVYNHYPPVRNLNSVGAGIAWNVNKFAEVDLSGGIPLKSRGQPATLRRALLPPPREVLLRASPDRICACSATANARRHGGNLKADVALRINAVGQRRASLTM